MGALRQNGAGALEAEACLDKALDGFGETDEEDETTECASGEDLDDCARRGGGGGGGGGGSSVADADAVVNASVGRFKPMLVEGAGVENQSLA